MRSRVWLSFFLLAAPGCDAPQSSGIPPTIEDYTLEDAETSSQELEKTWLSFAAALQLNISGEGSKSSEVLEEELRTPSGLLSDASYQDTTQKLISIFTDADESQARPSNATRCASIERISPLSSIKAHSLDPVEDQKTELANVSVYKLEYVLNSNTLQEVSTADSSNLGDQVVRSALLTVPTLEAGTQVPLVVYGHGGDNGLNYTEMARVFGNLQQQLVIVAPSFPDEPICEEGFNTIIGSCVGATISSPSGVSRPFDTDANEMLGLQDCITRAVYKQESDASLSALGLNAPLNNETGETTNETLNATLANALRRYGELSGATTTDAFSARHPVSHLVGSSRGSMTSLIALAKSGASHRAESSREGKISLSRFQCTALLFPPTTFTMGTFRLALELFVKGLAEFTRFFALPTADQLIDMFKDFREGNISTDEMLLKYIPIDALLNIHLSTTALRNWSGHDPANPSNTSPGKLLAIHGSQDKVVNSEQSLYFGQQIGLASQRVRGLGWAPGATSSILAFAPPADTPYPTGNPFSDAIFQHGDTTFFRSTQIADSSVDANQPGWGIISGSAAPSFYDSSFMNESGSTPPEAFKTWMSANCSL